MELLILYTFSVYGGCFTLLILFRIRVGCLYLNKYLCSLLTVSLNGLVMLYIMFMAMVTSVIMSNTTSMVQFLSVDVCSCI